MADAPSDDLKSRMEALRTDGARGRKSGGAAPWLVMAGIALVAGVGVFLWDQSKREAAAPLAASTAAPFQEGSRIGAVPFSPPARAPAAAPQRVEIEVAAPAPAPAPAPPVDDGRIAALQAVVDDLRRELDAQSAGDGDRADDADEAEARRLDELARSNEALAAELAAAKDTRERELAAERLRFEAKLQSELAAMRAELIAARPAPASAPTPAPAAPVNAGFNPAEAAEAAERRRIAAEQARVTAEAEAARQAQADARRKAAEELAARQISAPAVVYDGKGVIGSAPVAAGEPARRPANDNERFFSAAGAERPVEAVATPLADPGQTVVEGTFIQGVLETAIDSSLPGSIRAAVTEDVYSYDGRNVLLPRGTRLIGTYRSDLELTQERALVVWSRAVTPAGLSMQIASSGADRLGRSGVTGFVDTHFWERFGSAALISVIGAVPAVVADRAGSGDVVGETVENVGEDFRGATSSVVEEYLSIAPTIHVDQGGAITVFVSRDVRVPGA